MASSSLAAGFSLSSANAPAMAARLYDRDHFEAEVTIFSETDGGRRTPAFNGIRRDFGYADENAEDGIYMIWPDFFDEHGNSLDVDAALPIGIPLGARFTIVNDDLRHFHQSRIEPGLDFYCHEGNKRVAKGTVTRITGLNNASGH